MTEVLKTQISVTLTNTETNTTDRLDDNFITHEPKTHATGKLTLAGNTVDHQICTQMNMLHLFCAEGEFAIKVGNTTETEHLKMKMFTYDGEMKDFFISNKGTDDIVIEYTYAKY